jgi:GrpB-like predicted nucleotidyltransferase (UPF0157 family)
LSTTIGGGRNSSQREAGRIRAALDQRVLRLEHTGSTSIPGPAAKPIIDITRVVDNSANEAGYLPDLQRAGYRLGRREPPWHEHRMLKGPDTEINFRVFSAGCPEVARILRFRDWLRSHPADHDLYARTKLSLAQREWDCMDD